MSHIGEPRLLPRSGGVVLVRPVPDAGLSDIVGPYPWAGFASWAFLDADLAELTDRGLVTATMVISPTSQCTKTDLERAFPDRLVDFKAHYIVDLAGDFARDFRSSHRRKSRRADLAADFEELDQPLDQAGRWIELYSMLVDRHRIVGPAAFPEESLRAQLGLAAMRTFVARVDTRIVGMITFMCDGTDAAYHLGAYAPEGYEREVAFGLFPFAFAALASAGIERLNLGGGAGASVDDDDGLARFKRGWSTRCEMSRLGGRVLDRGAFDELDMGRTTEFWPPYRAPQTAL